MYPGRLSGCAGRQCKRATCRTGCAHPLNEAVGHVAVEALDLAYAAALVAALRPGRASRPCERRRIKCRAAYPRFSRTFSSSSRPCASRRGLAAAQTTAPRHGRGARARAACCAPVQVAQEGGAGTRASRIRAPPRLPHEALGFPAHARERSLEGSRGWQGVPPALRRTPRRRGTGGGEERASELHSHGSRLENPLPILLGEPHEPLALRSVCGVRVWRWRSAQRAARSSAPPWASSQPL